MGLPTAASADGEAADGGREGNPLLPRARTAASGDGGYAGGWREANLT